MCAFALGRDAALTSAYVEANPALAVIRILVFILALLATSLEAPDCAYSRYGCTYLIWYHDDGIGEALVSCDQGATHFWYTGRVGTCPGTDQY